MTIKEVKAKVAEIATLGARDSERAHAVEDDLFEAVLRAIANDTASGTAVPRGVRALARAALKTKRFTFPRWSA